MEHKIGNKLGDSLTRSVSDEKINITEYKRIIWSLFFVKNIN